MSVVIRPLGSGSGTGSAVSLLNKVQLDITDAQIKALPTTPLVLIPAPGANKVAVPVLCYARLKWTANYTNIDAAAFIGIVNPSTVPIDRIGTSSLREASGLTMAKVSTLLANGASASAMFTTVQNNDPAAPRDIAFGGMSDGVTINQSIKVSVDNGVSGNFTGGDPANVLRVTAYYVIVDTL